MPNLSPNELLAAVIELGICRREQLAGLSASGKAEASGQRLAQMLAERGLLTSYQAEQVLQGCGKQLVLGAYLILEPLGFGGSAQVYKARHVHLDRLVALKMIRSERLATTTTIERFYREARAVAKLSHPNIVLCLDAQQAGQRHYLVMEYLEGADLGRQVKSQGPLPLRLACDYIRQAALGLQHAHDSGLVHRDIKPANLMLVDGPKGAVVKVLDFGLALPASELSGTARMTQIGKLLGTVDYIAPEQAEDARKVDARTDIYALGCTFYYLLVGKPPFEGDDLVERLAARLLRDAPLVSESRADVPPALARFIARMLARDPAQRPQTAAEVATTLAKALAPRPKSDPSISPAPTFAFASSTRLTERPGKLNAGSNDGRTQVEASLPIGPSRHRSWLVGLIAAGAFLLICAATVAVAFGLRGASPTPPVVMNSTNPATAPLPAPVKPTSAEPTMPAIVKDETPGKPEELAPQPPPEPPPTPPPAVTAQGGISNLSPNYRPERGNLPFRYLTKPVTGLLPAADRSKLLLIAGSRAFEVDPEARVVDRPLPFDLPAGSAVAGAADGKLIAIAGARPMKTGGAGTAESYPIYLFDLAAGKEARKLVGHSTPVTCLAFSADGKQVLSGAETVPPPRPGGREKADGIVRLWDVATGQQVRTFEGSTKSVAAVAFAGDGKRVIAAGADGFVRWWSIDTGKELLKRAVQAPVVCLKVSPDNKLVLIGDSKGGLVCYDQDSRTQVMGLKPRQTISSTWNLAFLPDSKHAVVTYGGTTNTEGRPGFQDCTVRLWDVRAGQVLSSHEAHKSLVRHVAISPEGNVARTVDQDGVMVTWVLPLGAAPTPAAAAPEDSDKAGNRFKPVTGSLPGRALPTLVNKFLLFPDGKRALSATALKVYELNLDNFKDDPLPIKLGVRRGAALSPDGKLLLAIGGQFARTKAAPLAPQGCEVLAFDVATGQTRHTLMGHDSMVTCAAFSPNGKLVASGALASKASDDKVIDDARGILRVWDLSANRQLHTLEGHVKSIRAVCFSTDGQRVISASEDGSVRWWDVETGRLLFQADVSVAVQCLAVSPDNRLVLFGDISGGLSCVDQIEKKQVMGRRPADRRVPIWAVAFLPDSRHAVTATGWTRSVDGQLEHFDCWVRLYDIQRDELLSRHQAHRNIVQQLAISPDGKTVWSVDHDSMLVKWDVPPLDAPPP